MRKSRFSAREIREVLDEVASGLKVAEVCIKHGISVPTYYLWKAKFGRSRNESASPELEIPVQALPVNSEDSARMLARIKQLEQENVLLRKLFIEISIENASIKMRESAKALTVIA